MEENGQNPNNGQAEKNAARRKTLRRLRWVAWLLVLIPIVYVLVQVVIILMPRMRTQLVEQATMTDSLEVEGYVALQSVPVQAGGVMYYTVDTGQRVSAGGEVAYVYEGTAGAEAMAKLENVNNEIALLETAQATVAEGGNVDIFLKQMEDGLTAYLAALETGNYEQLADPCNEMELAANQMQVATGEAVDFSARLAWLQEQKAALEAQAAPSGTLTAPETGYFVPAESRDRVLRSYEELAEVTPGTLEQMLAEPPEYYESTMAGHIVTDYHWRFFTVVSAKDAERFVEGTKLEINFPEVSEQVMPVEVQQVVLDEEAGLAKIELLCERINPDILRLRVENAQIIFNTQKGLQIEKSALRVIEGETCVYVKYGNQVYLRRVQVLVDDGQYILIPETSQEGVNEVELYDEVVVDAGGVELYDKRIL